MDAQPRRDFGRAGRRAPWPSRRAVFRTAIILLLLALPLLFWVTRGWNRWHDPFLLGGVGLLSLACACGDLRLKHTASYSLDDAFAVIALIVGGPAAAFLVYFLPDLVTRLTFRRLTPWGAGAWATYASYGWCALAAGGVLSLGHVHGLDPAGLPTMMAAGLVLVLVNWVIARGLFGALWKRMRLAPMFRDEYLGLIPLQVSVLAFGLTVVMLAPIVGVVGYVPLIGLVLIPQVLLPWLASSRDITRLSPEQASVVYARALLGHLGANRSERRLTLAAAKLLSGPGRAELTRSGIRLPGAPADLPIGGGAESDSWRIALHVPERWNGAGHPAGLPGRMIPKESRLLAVATAWASLTAAGGPGLPQTEAVLALEAQAGTRLDPRIVAAASEIVTTEAEFADIGTFQPRLDLLPVPTVIRSELLPWALKHAVA